MDRVARVVGCAIACAWLCVGSGCSETAPSAETFATWSDIQAHARGNYQLAEDNLNSFKLIFEYDDERLQAVIVSHHESMGREWCDFASATAARDDIPADDVLRKNFELAAGALALDDDIYVMRYSVELAKMDAEGFELNLHLVATTAEEIGKVYVAEDYY